MVAYQLPICPTCKQTDQVQKVTSLYASNTKEWKETSTGIDSWGNTTTTEHLRTAHTTLGLKLKPPEEPTSPTHPGIWYGFGGLIIFFLCSILGPIGLSLLGVIASILGGLIAGSTMLPNIAGLPVWLITSLVLGLPILCSGVVVVALIFWLGSKIRDRFNKDMKSYREKKAVFDRDERPRWERAKTRWEQLHYCLRDESLFIPGENKIIPVDEMEKHLYAM
ncbi:MAG TPA: hypothetical protein PK078_14535 [Anaerolineales bacterium]|nr:hypothetical protein [Anaerolineales bacterium]